MVIITSPLSRTNGLRHRSLDSVVVYRNHLNFSILTVSIKQCKNSFSEKTSLSSSGVTLLVLFIYLFIL